MKTRTLLAWLVLANLVCMGLMLGMWVANGDVGSLAIGVFNGLTAIYTVWVWRRGA